MSETRRGERWWATRQDDNGNVFTIRDFATRDAAQRYADMLTARGHKQLYMVERRPSAT